MGLVSEKLLPRIPIIEVFPVIEDGTLPAKATEGEPFPLRATVFREGHDAFAAEAVLLRGGYRLGRCGAAGVREAVRCRRLCSWGVLSMVGLVVYAPVSVLCLGLF